MGPGVSIAAIIVAMQDSRPLVVRDPLFREHVPLREHPERHLPGFEAFLVRWHEGGASFTALCAEHPQHAERFTRWWEQLLHNQSALILKGRLLFRRNTVVVSVPYHIDQDQVDVPGVMEGPSHE
jgi:hypothetical protein